MNEEIINLKKSIKYKLSYSGTKETDILYQKLILKKIDKLDKKNLLLLISLFKEFSDIEIFAILTNNSEKPHKYKDLINKIKNE